MIATIRKDGKRYVTKPVIPKTACTTKTTRNETKRLVVVIVKLSEPINRRNAPTEATILIAWSAKNSLHENTRRGCCGLICGSAAGSSCGNTCELTGNGATLASSRTSDKEGLATTGATGACASTETGGTAGEINVLRWRTAFKRN